MCLSGQQQVTMDSCSTGSSPSNSKRKEMSIYQTRKKLTKGLKSEHQNDDIAFQINISYFQIIVVVCCCIVASFNVGQFVQDRLSQESKQNLLVFLNKASNTDTASTRLLSQSSYTYKDFSFPKARSACSAIGNDIDRSNSCKATYYNETSSCRNWDEAADGNFPESYGQSIMVDIEHVNTDFLSSTTLLTEAMVKLVEDISLNMLSYHCHDIIPVGVSCVGILLKGHLSFHTWPQEGVITVDLFTSGTYSFIHILPSINKLFGKKTSLFVNDQDNSILQNKDPHTLWSHRRRGFVDYTSDDHSPEETDIGWMLGPIEIEKENIVSVQSNFQHISIYDVIDPRFRTLEKHELSLSKNDSFESRNAKLYQKDRIVYLDGVMQSRRFGEAAYHEALVHPAMFAHPNPQRVAIIGGGEGATLREVLKHKTVNKAVMIEIDEIMVNVSKEYLPEWSDCSDLVDSSSNCFDDPRAETYYEDAIQWFIQRFGTDVDYSEDSVFDVIIMDALDPDSVADFSDFLYDNKEFSIALSNALGKTGVFVAQIGQIDDSDEPPNQIEDDRTNTFINHFIDADFEHIRQYSESHGGFSDPWVFLLAMKDKDTQSRWMLPEAELNIEMKKRSTLTRSGESPFKYFDGATLETYEFPSRIMEDVWCTDNPDECMGGHGYDPDIRNIPQSSFSVGISTIAKGGRGIFTNEFIPQGSSIGLDSCVHGMFIPTNSYKRLDDMMLHFSEVKYFMTFFMGYIDGYGWHAENYGEQVAGVDPGILTFMNHGCHGSYNVGILGNVTESSTGANTATSDKLSERELEFNPYSLRHFPGWGCQDYLANRDINIGEEMLDNYIGYGGDLEFDKNLQELQALCSGDLGLVSRYEQQTPSLI